MVEPKSASMDEFDIPYSIMETPDSFSLVFLSAEGRKDLRSIIQASAGRIRTRREWTGRPFQRRSLLGMNDVVF
jgi:hypothetical protein